MAWIQAGQREVPDVTLNQFETGRPPKILQPKTRGSHSSFTNMCKMYTSPPNLGITVFFETVPDNFMGILASEIYTDLKVKLGPEKSKV